MNTKAFLLSALMALAMVAAPASAAVKTIVLPPDGAQLKPSPLPGYARAQGN